MTTTQTTTPETPINQETLHQLIGGILQDLGGAFSVPLVQIGESLGIYETLKETGPMTSQELANKTGLHERYSRGQGDAWKI